MEQAKSPSVIVISGADQKLLRATSQRAESLGFESHFLTKPLNLVGLRLALSNCCRRAPIRRGFKEFRVGDVG